MAILSQTLRACGVLIFVLVGVACAGTIETRPPYPRLYNDQPLLRDAIAASGAIKVPAACTVTGVVVPHHLLAATFIADAFRVVKACHYKTIIILSPDHFHRANKPFASTRRDFGTAYGLLKTDRKRVDRLLARPDLVEDSDLFATEHGIGAILPFVAHFDPDAKIVPIAVALGSQQSDWDAIVNLLEPMLDESTLIVQSTDFSHHLNPGEARIHDQQTLNVLSANDLAAAAKLVQPAHVDSVGALYIQMKIQQEVFLATPVVLRNANTQDFSPRPVDRPTSYVVAVYETRPSDIARPVPGSKVFCFVGDTFFGRGIAAAFVGVAGRHKIERLRRRLAGCPLIINFSGVVVPEPVANPRPAALAITRAELGSWLKDLDIVAIGFANNHVNDFGTQASQDSVRAFEAEGIVALRPGAVADLKFFRVVALSDGDNASGLDEGIITAADIERLARSQVAPPLIAFLHWGQEFEAAPTARQQELVERLKYAGTTLILGAGSHVASDHLQQFGGGQTTVGFGLGNFLFDQAADRTSGAIVEVRAFAQGTIFARLLKLDVGEMPSPP